MESPPDNSNSKQIGPVPKAVIARLSLYLRELQHWEREGKETISSTQLGKLLGFTDAQVRKDFAYFGQFGYPGIGYRCAELTQAIKVILGTDRSWPVALVGCGNLGQALLGYGGFSEQGFRIVAAFDSSPSRIGQSIAGVKIESIDSFLSLSKQLDIRMVLLAVPAAVAQEVADTLVGAGVTGILNFAPVTLSLPRTVQVVGVDLAIELEQLAYAVVKTRT
ncbi:MAG: redox-sensing transcriptional repressor Rex [Planctomycetales bacterium]|nr:redox-sensing transcriptional repressor Rex [Planctomycetales bacterium]